MRACATQGRSTIPARANIQVVVLFIFPTPPLLWMQGLRELWAIRSRRDSLGTTIPTATLECVAQNFPRRITILQSPATRETAFEVLLNPCVRSVCSRSVAV